MILGHTLILLLCFLYASRLIGTIPALISFLFVAFEPYHIALTRLLHLDGLVGNLMLLSMLAFIYYAEKRVARDLIVSAIAADWDCSPSCRLSYWYLSSVLLTVYICWKNKGTQERDYRPGWSSPVSAYLERGV